MRTLPFAVLALTMACNSASLPSSQTDLAQSSQLDLAQSSQPDLALSSSTDLGGALGDLARTCSAGCRTYSSYCSTNPCVCIPLAVGQPDPVCKGTMTVCTVDPCRGKSASCVNGACALN
jgi:hypothetical protein